MPLLLYCFCLLFVTPILGAAENTLVLGAAGGWGMVENRTQVDEMAAVRPHAVLTLSSAWTGSLSGGAALAGTSRNADDDILALYAAYRNFPAQESALDLALSFDEARPGGFADSRGRYRVSVSAAVQSVNERWARYGRGAALFTGEDRYGGAPVTARPTAGALFAPGRSVRDFSIEFWLYPNTIENGEQIITWNAGEYQRIFCEAIRNRIRWTFQELFVPPERLSTPGRTETAGDTAGQRRITITLESRAPLVPRNWSHHLLRYNADTGLLEYLVNGRIENITYTTASGREGGDVYTPLINRDGAFILGSRFSGMLDEFRIYNRVINAPGHTALEEPGKTALELPDLAKFPRSGGRIETRAIDLGESGSTVLKIEASGGRLGSAGGRRMTVKNTYEGRGTFRFPDNSAVQFFIRAGEEPYRFGAIPWIPVIPGEAAPPMKGRYVQLAAAFYPSGDCSTSPYLEEVRIIYDKNDPPQPPSWVNARALDGVVELSWRASPDENVRGYLIYYGTSSGIYYGQGAALGGSPIDAGNRTSLRLEGLRNGTLYFFTVAAYSGTGPGIENLHPGNFSREVNARPLRTNE
jgi:hypothetical protein